MKVEKFKDLHVICAHCHENKKLFFSDKRILHGAWLCAPCMTKVFERAFAPIPKTLKDANKILGEGLSAYKNI